MGKDSACEEDGGEEGSELHCSEYQMNVRLKKIERVELKLGLCCSFGTDGESLGGEVVVFYIPVLPVDGYIEDCYSKAMKLCNYRDSHPGAQESFVYFVYRTGRGEIEA